MCMHRSDTILDDNSVVLDVITAISSPWPDDLVARLAERIGHKLEEVVHEIIL